ncbi:MAG: hypothetical protein EOO99_07040 [Pedobacter sp.]|nr:MAG: hypothetical protein EOO99_07040 [Pedobacter sp.]
MNLQKYRFLIVIAFLSIFAAKMVISGAPVFFKSLDKDLMISVIMQLENENHGEESNKASLKFVDYKWTFDRTDFHSSIELKGLGVTNDFIEHYRRYVNPYHPSVPTPPPNFS